MLPEDLPEGPARTLATLAIRSGMTVLDAIVEEPREAVHAPLPSRYRKGAARRYVKARLGKDGEPWRHQSGALAQIAAGNSVVVTTPTASGKSLVFQTHALDVAERGGKVLVLYPAKALATDQTRSWREAARLAKLPDAWVTEITGDVAVFLRKEAMEGARILAMTPDTVHSWLMRNLDDKEVRTFLASLDTVVLDEAHVLDAAFGSSMALLLRRLQLACDICRIKRRAEPSPLTYIASSATIDDPVGHMRKLTGREFVEIPETQDGSPRHGRVTLHLNPPEADNKAMSELQRLVAAEGGHPFITFCEGRKAVETLAATTQDKAVLPYRNGFESTDRALIEDGLRDGRLKGVVSTSALEMGIDMGRIGFGFNMDVKASRRSIRQRIGRVGRASPGAFAVVANRTELERAGETFRDYVTGPVEPSNVYLENGYLHFQHARCLHAELAALGVRQAGGKRPPPLGVGWPKGFEDAFAAAAPGVDVPNRYADVAKLDRGNPHLDYGLRIVGERTLDIVTPHGKKIGSIPRMNALGEAYPEGTYLHMGRRYTVSTWKPGFFGPQVVVRPGAKGLTAPIRRTTASARLEGDSLVEGRISANGAMAETRLLIKDSVIGYMRTSTKETFLYRPGMGSTPKHRHLNTTGVVMRMPFLADRPEERLDLAKALTARFRRNHGISTGDVGCVTTHVGLRRDNLIDQADDAIVVYDNIQGSLRLTSRLFDEMPSLVRSLIDAGHEAIVGRADRIQLEEWVERLSSGPREDLFPVPAEMASLDAFPSGTVARRKGATDGAVLTLRSPLLERTRTGVNLCYEYVSGTSSGIIRENQMSFDGPMPQKEEWSPERGFETETPALRFG